jgi:hypothetical protein
LEVVVWPAQLAEQRPCPQHPAQQLPDGFQSVANQVVVVERYPALRLPLAPVLTLALKLVLKFAQHAEALADSGASPEAAELPAAAVPMAAQTMCSPVCR